jgi:hypothetical protein
MEALWISLVEGSEKISALMNEADIDYTATARLKISDTQIERLWNWPASRRALW